MTTIEAKVSAIVREAVPLLNSEMTVGEEFLGFTAVGSKTVAVKLFFLS